MARELSFGKSYGDKLPLQEATLGTGDRWHPDTREQQAWTLGGEGEETGQGGIPLTSMPLAIST